MLWYCCIIWVRVSDMDKRVGSLILIVNLNLNPPATHHPRNAISLVEIQDELPAALLKGDHAAVPIGLHERAVIDLGRRVVHGLAVDLRRLVLIGKKSK